MKVCVFCGELGGTREHITSTAVQKRMQLSGVEIEIGVREASIAPVRPSTLFQLSLIPEAKARMRSLMDALEWLGSERRKLITRQEEVG